MIDVSMFEISPFERHQHVQIYFERRQYDLNSPLQHRQLIPTLSDACPADNQGAGFDTKVRHHSFVDIAHSFPLAYVH